MSAARRQRRQRERSHAQRPPRSVGTFEGVPVYDGHVVQPVSHPVAGEHVMLGIGRPGEDPIAFLALCPTDGVRHLIDDLRDAAAPLAEHHCASHPGGAT